VAAVIEEEVEPPGAIDGAALAVTVKVGFSTETVADPVAGR
jgi:hypothetical protein